MHLKKQVTKPRKQLSTKDKERRPHIYDKCRCGAMKAVIAKQCQQCKIDARKTVVSRRIFWVNKKPCRYIPLTQGQAAIVSAHRYKELSAHEWYALYNACIAGFYAVRNARRGENGRTTIHMHREIVKYAGDETDHKNHNTLDNRDENLRPCTSSQNRANTIVRSKSGFKGVYQIKRNNKTNPWAARITIKGKGINIGNFPTPEIAARAYDREAIKAFGEFARINFPSDHAGPASTSSVR